MPHRHFAAVVPLVVRYGLVPGPVGGETGIPGQGRDVGQAVGHLGRDRREHVQGHFAGQIAPARALQGGEVVAVAGRPLETQAVLLKKGATAGAGFEHPLHTQAQPLVVRKLRAGPEVRSRAGGVIERLVEAFVHRCGVVGERNSNRH